MPESVRDRCTKSHEYIFLFSKNQNYYFDVDAIKEPTVDGRGLKERKVYGVLIQNHIRMHILQYSQKN